MNFECRTRNFEGRNFLTSNFDIPYSILDVQGLYFRQTMRFFLQSLGPWVTVLNLDANANFRKII